MSATNKLRVDMFLYLSEGSKLSVHSTSYHNTDVRLVSRYTITNEFSKEERPNPFGCTTK